MKTHTVNKFAQGFQPESNLPLVPFPPGFEFFNIKDSSITISETRRMIVNDRFGVADTAYRTIPMPEIDRIGSLYVNDRLPYTFTKAFIDYESERSGMLSSRGNQDSGTVGWSFDVLKLFSGKSGGEVSLEYQKQLSASSQYWLGNQENRAKLGTMENQVMWKYLHTIRTLTFKNPFNNKIDTVGSDRSEWFLKKFNEFIDERINKFFDSARRMNNNR